MRFAMTVVRVGAAVGIVATGLIAGGCAGGGGGASYSTAMPAGSSCKSIRRELNVLDSKGVPARIEAKNAGKKLSPKHNAQVARYNQLLNQYLGSKCHV